MKRTLKLGSYIIERENGYLKISHENKSWNFRLAGGPEDLDKFFENCKEEDWRKYYELVFASTQTFTILGMQNPQYVEAWMAFHNAYFDALSDGVAPEDDKAILAEEEVLHNMREEAGKEEVESVFPEDFLTETDKTAEQ